MSAALIYPARRWRLTRQSGQIREAAGGREEESSLTARGFKHVIIWTADRPVDDVPA
jgi:hypothetical protein